MSDKNNEGFYDSVNQNIEEFFRTLDNGIASIHDAFVFMQQKLQAAEEREKILREAVEYYKWATIGDLEENDMVQLRERPNIWANGKRARKALEKTQRGSDDQR